MVRATDVLLQCAEVLKVAFAKYGGDVRREKANRERVSRAHCGPVCTYYTNPQEGSRAPMVRSPGLQKHLLGCNPLYHHLPGAGGRLDLPLLQFCPCVAAGLLNRLHKSNS